MLWKIQNISLAGTFRGHLEHLTSSSRLLVNLSVRENVCVWVKICRWHKAEWSSKYDYNLICKKWTCSICIRRMKFIGINKFCILPQISMTHVEAVEQEWREITRYSEEGWWLGQILYCGHARSINWCAGSYSTWGSCLCSQSGGKWMVIYCFRDSRLGRIKVSHT